MTPNRRMVIDTNVVSGDGDLLVLNPFRGIAIITPEMFLRSVNEQEKRKS